MAGGSTERGSKQRKTNWTFNKCLGCTGEEREHGGDVKDSKATQ